MIGKRFTLSFLCAAVLLLSPALIRPAEAACAAPVGNAGAIVYNATGKIFQYCNDTVWVRMNESGSGSGGCANPTAVEGEMIYNADARVLQGCAGSAHKAFGPVGGEAGWSLVASGTWTVCGIKTDGALWCWGADWSGQLGNGAVTTGTQTSPVRVGTDTWKTVSTMQATTCGIKYDDTLWCWGDDADSQLGDGASTASQTSPVQISGGGTWKAVDVGVNHACGIKSDNTAWCWGRDGVGQLGNGGTTGVQNAPSAVTGGFSWKAISAGNNLTCGITSTDVAYCWGSDGNGQLGNGGTAGNQTSPSPVSGGLTWKKISAGGSSPETHACGITMGDVAYCWGSDSNGQLGNAAGYQAAPDIVAGGATWIDISAGDVATCGIKTGGAVWCWGGNWDGRVGDGTKADQGAPVAVLGGGTYTKLGFSSGTPCAIRSDNSLRCWGSEDTGGLGDGEEENTAYRYVPVPVSGGHIWTKVVGHLNTTCGLKTNGTIWCWGDNGMQQLGSASPAESPTPLQLPGADVWTDVATGYTHACGIKNDGTAWCWGERFGGKLGDGGVTTGSTATPVQVAGGGTWSKLAAGEDSTCGIKTDNTLWCWGERSYGRVGDGGATTGNQTTPVQIAGTWTKISVAFGHACAIKTDGSAWCWGHGDQGKTGAGNTTDRNTPYNIFAGADTWIDIDAGVNHSCGIKTGGTAWCWGFGTTGQLGNGAAASSLTAVAVSGGGTWKSISAGDIHSCGVKSDDTVLCWGDNSTGALGNASITQSNSPVAISGSGTWGSLSAANYYSCAVATDQKTYCWGSKTYGQLGNGEQIFVAPTQPACGQPYGKAGAVVYNGDKAVLQYCDGAGWVGIRAGLTAAVPDPCLSSPGTECTDGTVYAGLSPDGSVPMFVPHCDAGQTWNGTTCTGTRTAMTWNSGSVNWVDTPIANCTTVPACTVSGETNTATLIATDSDSVTGGVQQHVAAQYCEDLVVNGKSDWYLPASPEMEIVYNNKAAIGNFDLTGTVYYWSSSEYSNFIAWNHRMSDFAAASGTKNISTYYVRCARR